jgi:copper transport protein
VVTRLRGLVLRAAFAAACLFLFLPAAALGHASLVDSSPSRGAELETSPKQVVFEFSEPVEASFGALKVFDPSGKEVDTGQPFQPGGNENKLAAAITPKLEDGLYTAVYRVISADSHPVAGGIVFSVGEAGPGSGKTISELLAASETGPVTDAAFWLDRWIAYLAIAAAIGALSFLLMLWAPALRDQAGQTGGQALSALAVEAAGPTRILLLAAVAAGLITSAAALPLQGAVAAGSDFWSALDPGVIGDVIDTRFGSAVALRLPAWLLLIPLAITASRAFSDRRPSRRLPVPSAVAGAVLLVVSPALAGHAATVDPGWLMLSANVAHVAAMAFWTGGLLALIVILPAVTRRLASDLDRSRILTSFLIRFSGLALVAVALIAASGSIQAILQLDAPGDLWQTAYGRALSAKIVLFIALIVLASLNRQKLIPALVRRKQHGLGPGAPGRSVRRNLRLEVALAVVVLAATAALVASTPPATGTDGPVSGSVPVGNERLDYTVDPALQGSNEVHLYIFDNDDGAPVDVDSLEINFALPDSAIPPVEAEARRAGPGHFVVPSAMLAVRGDWLAEVAVRFSRFEAGLAEFEVPVE